MIRINHLTVVKIVVTTIITAVITTTKKGAHYEH